MSSSAFAVQHVEETLQKQGRMRLSAIGVSMLPLIRPGDEMEVAACLSSEIKPGDIVLVKKNNFFLLHRIHSVSDGEIPVFLTKGDNVTRYDPPTGADSITGKVISVGNWRGAKALWQILDQAAIFFLIRLPQWHKRLAQKPFYITLAHAKNALIGRRTFVTPVIKKAALLIPWLANMQQRVQQRRQNLKLTFFLPKTHFLEVSPDGPIDKILPLWNESFPDLYFESASALNDNLFFHPLADNPLCFIAERKGRCLGLLSAVRRFPNAQGETVCSLEALAVDPDFRRNGIGSGLLETLKNKCRASGIRQIFICRNYLFFTGLHPERHEQMISFLLNHGFDSPIFFDEMFLASKNIARAESFKAADQRLALSGFSFRPLEKKDRAAFLVFLQKEDRELHNRYSQKNLFASSGLKNEGLIVAAHGEDIVGFLKYDRLKNETGPAGFYREWLVRKLTQANTDNLFILSHVFVLKDHQGRGVGGTLFKAGLDILLAIGAEGFIFDSLIPKFYRRFGASKIDRHLKLQSSAAHRANQPQIAFAGKTGRLI